MKTHYTFETGDRVIAPYGAGTVEKIKDKKCLITYDICYGFGRRTPVDPEESATWHSQDDLRPE